MFIDSLVKMPTRVTNIAGITPAMLVMVMPAMLVTRVGIFTNESMNIKDLDQYSITAKVNIHQEQSHLICFTFLRNAPVNLIVFCTKCSLFASTNRV